MTPAKTPITRKRKSLEERENDKIKELSDIRRQKAQRAKADDFRLTVMIGKAMREAAEKDSLLHDEIVQRMRPTISVPNDKTIFDKWANLSTR